MVVSFIIQNMLWYQRIGPKEDDSKENETFTMQINYSPENIRLRRIFSSHFRRWQFFCVETPSDNIGNFLRWLVFAWALPSSLSQALTEMYTCTGIMWMCMCRNVDNFPSKIRLNNPSRRLIKNFCFLIYCVHYSLIVQFNLFVF